VIQVLDEFEMKRVMPFCGFHGQTGDPQGRLRRVVDPGDRERRHQHRDHAVVVVQRRLMITRAGYMGVMRCGVLMSDGVMAVGALNSVYVAHRSNRRDADCRGQHERTQAGTLHACILVQLTPPIRTGFMTRATLRSVETHPSDGRRTQTLRPR
jgi:hypothetical protein